MATLTIFSDNGDGWVDNNNATYATARSAGTGTSANSGNTSIDASIVSRSILFGGLYYSNRGFFPFDTSVLGSGATVTGATMGQYIEVSAVYNTNSDSLSVVQTSQASTSSLATTDFGSVTFTDGGSKTLASFSVANQYWTWTLNGTGLGWINKTGFTKIGLMSLNEINNTTPTGLNQLGGPWYFSDNTGTSKDPYLTITYTTPVTTPKFFFNFNESSGNATDAVNSLSGVNTSATFSTGKLNNAAYFNGSAYFTVADNALLEPTSDISFGGWVYISSTSSFQMIMAKGENAGDTRSYELRCNGTTTQMQVQLRVGGGSYCACTSTTAIGTGVWAHVIYTRSGTTQKIYINGVSDTLTSVTNNSGNIDYSTDDLWIGQRNGGLRFNGRLDMIGLWDVVLTQAEVSQLYESGTGIEYPFSVPSFTPSPMMHMMQIAGGNM